MTRPSRLLIVLVQPVVAEAQTNARMALAYLERCYPERWRKARRLGHTGAGGVPSANGDDEDG